MIKEAMSSFNIALIGLRDVEINPVGYGKRVE
jgi:hypothetical protein